MKKVFYGYKQLWGMISTKDKTLFLLLILNNIFYGISAIIPIQLVMLLVNKLSGVPLKFFGIEIYQNLNLVTIIVISILFLLLKEIWNVLRQYWQWRYATNVVYKIKRQSFSWAITPRKNMNLKISLGDASHRIMVDTESIYNLIEEPFDKYFYTLFSAFSAIVYISVLNYFNIIAIVISLILLVGLIFYRNIRTIPQSKERAYLSGKLNNDVINSVKNLPEIMVNHSMQYEKDRLDNSIMKIEKNWKMRHKTLFIYWFLSALVTICAIVFILGFAIKDIINGSLLATELIVIFNYIYLVFEPITELGWRIGTIEIASAKVDRISQLMPKESEQLGCVESNEKIEKIELKNVSVKYNETTNIKNLNFIFNMNSLSVISGRSGCGKSTVANLCAGLIEKSSGKILVNDKPVENMYSYINQIGYSFQDAYIFNLTLEENIAYPNKEFDYKNKYFKKLKLLELLKRKQNCEHEQIDSRELSGGEKKRIEIVRTVLSEKPILIFDEPTNELDNQNVKVVIDMLLELKKEHMIIVVSHDSRIIECADVHYDFEKR